MEKVTNVAVLIDAENVASHSAKQIFDEASNYGNIMVKRIFADWSKTSVRGWKEEVNRYSMTAVQQFEVQARKNTTDIALIIQALLILFEKDVDVFCIAAGDSDYTRLVRELRERDKIVIGLGGRNVNQSYVNAFNEFIYLDAGEEKPAAPKRERGKGGKAQAAQPAPAPQESEIIDNKRKSDLHNIIDRMIDNNGKAFYAQISSEMKQKYSDFIPKNFGCNSFKKLMEKLTPYLKKYSIGTEADGTTMYLYRSSKK
ncbi:MAG TPA: NYN domain-containing protein [Candidatus Borkfalkia faecavium]|uniref:NYN domain-containing protein n=1 Tax=Candidatus Borkfalkia faecavium TaxID=2838508 RepID=A0A9D1W0M9_9FIRM|nr:NYN domain-containing protein [Candidatus Borkfalkia faecavium]